MNKDAIISAIMKLYDDNYELTKKNIELDGENSILKDKVSKLTQGNKSKQTKINELQEQIQQLERKIIKIKSENIINNINTCRHIKK